MNGGCQRYELGGIADHAHRDDPSGARLYVDGSEDGVPGARDGDEHRGLSVQRDDTARDRDGHAAAQAVWDKEGAQREFDRFTRGHLPWSAFRLAARSIPPDVRISMFEKSAALDRLGMGIFKLALSNLPGYKI